LLWGKRGLINPPAAPFLLNKVVVLMRMYIVTINFNNGVQPQRLSSCPQAWLDVNLGTIMTGPFFESVSIELEK